MGKQMVVRTYPKGYINATKALNDAFNDGFVVVMSNPFDCDNGTKGTEYILENKSLIKN